MTSPDKCPLFLCFIVLDLDFPNLGYIIDNYFSFYSSCIFKMYIVADFSTNHFILHCILGMILIFVYH